MRVSQGWSRPRVARSLGRSLRMLAVSATTSWQCAAVSASSCAWCSWPWAETPGVADADPVVRPSGLGGGVGSDGGHADHRPGNVPEGWRRHAGYRDEFRDVVDLGDLVETSVEFDLVLSLLGAVAATATGRRQRGLPPLRLINPASGRRRTGQTLPWAIRQDSRQPAANTPRSGSFPPVPVTGARREALAGRIWSFQAGMA
jgi:hypothetical protein